MWNLSEIHSSTNTQTSFVICEGTAFIRSLTGSFRCWSLGGNYWSTLYNKKKDAQVIDYSNLKVCVRQNVFFFVQVMRHSLPNPIEGCSSVSTLACIVKVFEKLSSRTRCKRLASLVYRVGPVMTSQRFCCNVQTTSGVSQCRSHQIENTGSFTWKRSVLTSFNFWIFLAPSVFTSRQ